MYSYTNKTRESIEYNAQEDLDKIYPKMPSPRLEIYRKDYVSKASDATVVSEPELEPVVKSPVIESPAPKVVIRPVVIRPGPKKGKNSYAGRPKRILSPEGLYQRRMVVKSFMDKGITNSMEIARIMNEIRSNVWHDMLWLKKQPRSRKAQEKELVVTLKKSR